MVSLTLTETSLYNTTTMIEVAQEQDTLEQQGIGQINQNTSL